MTSILEGVIKRGTGKKLRKLNLELAGKTGTTNENKDAWFVGFDPEITVGVWVGYDEKISLGEGEEGAAVALPIWRDFMQAYIDGREEPETPTGFVPPPNIVFASVNPMTGDVTEPWANGAIQEVFIAGTKPGTTFRR